MFYCKSCSQFLSQAEALIHGDMWPHHYIVSADELENENQQEEK